MTTFNTTDLFNKTTTEPTAKLLSETELEAVNGGAGGLVDPGRGGAGGKINPQPLPPRHGPTDPRQF